MALVEIQNLTIHFDTYEGIVHAIDNISLSIPFGKTVCLVGESGCGKSVTARSIMRLLPIPPGKIISGKILFEEKDILSLSEKDLQNIRGNAIAMIFQDPMTSLNPVFTCGYQIQESFLIHNKITKKEAKEKAINLMKQVGIPEPHKRFHEYPHQFSGGMRQRIMIAMALACNPRLLIADEPTTALDVSIQAQILKLMSDLKQSHDMTMLFITHDLGVVAEIADDIIVLYAGRIVERGTASDIFEKALHPYTKGLLDSIPSIQKRQERLTMIPGTLPDPTAYPEGCRFYERCDRRSEMCKKQPSERLISKTHTVACFHCEK